MSAVLTRRRFLACSALGAVAARLGAVPALAARPRIRVGCQENGFPVRQGDFLGMLRTLPKMRELGYEGFECNIRFVLGEFSRIAEARRQIEDTGVAFISAHTAMTEAGRPGVFPRWTESVAALGASCIVMSNSGRAEAPYVDGNAWLRKASALEGLGKACRSAGLILAYHNHNPEFSHRNAQMDFLAQNTDPALVSFLMDAGHAHLGGGDPAAFMAAHSRRIFGCHLKTFKGGQRHQMPLGQGDWGFEDLAAAVRRTGWTGWLLSEEGGLAAPPDTAALGPDREYIRRVFGA